MLKAILVAGVVAFYGGRHFSLPIVGSIFTSILLFGLEILLYVLYKVQIYPYYISPLRTIPSPEGASFWFGHGKHELGTATGHIHDVWAKTVKNPHPSFYRYLGFGGEEKIVPTSAEAARQIMNNEAFEMPHWFREGSKPLLGDGLVSAEGPGHKILRKAVAPAFSPAQVRSFVPDFWEICLDMNRRIEAEIVSSGSKTCETNMLDWTNRVTFDMIGKTAYGAVSTFNALENPDTGFYSLFNRNYPLEGFTEPLDAFCIYVLPIFIPHGILDRLPIPAFQAQQRDRKIMTDEYKRLIRAVDISKFGQEEEGAIQKNLITVMVKGGAIDIDTVSHDLLMILPLSFILLGFFGTYPLRRHKINSPFICYFEHTHHQANRMLFKQMCENMMTFTGAGFGTNASALLWALYALVAHPEMQVRMRNEIRHVMKSSKEQCTAQLMDAMKYLHWFVMENSRFYPSIPGNWRECMQDTSVCGQTFAKGTQVVIPAFHVNRSTQNWGEDAEEFVPERWAPERLRKGAEHDGSLMTYSVGHKACIGKEYSIRAIKVVLIALIGNFEFEYDGPDPLKDLVPGITLRPRGGFRCMVKKAADW